MMQAVYLVLTFPLLGLGLLALARRPDAARLLLAHASLLLGGGALSLLIGPFGNPMFLTMRLLAWLLLLQWPLLLVASGWLLRAHHRRSARALGGLGLAMLLTATWSVGIEPRWLEVVHHRLPSPALTTPLRIALVADLQTDRLGSWERSIFARIEQARPDLVLFSGDYLQPDDMPTFDALRPGLQAMIAGVCGQARLGCVAVRGDVDPEAWPTLFATAQAVVLTESRTLALGPITLTALSPDDARADHPPVPAVDGYHVIMGHAPDFALARPPADLLLAGHVHGGQVRLPGLGPLLTLSRVPRAWAAGLTALPWGGTLIVSRGLGLERGDAPRLRLLCRPELVFVDLVPEPPPLPTGASSP